MSSAALAAVLAVATASFAEDGLRPPERTAFIGLLPTADRRARPLAEGGLEISVSGAGGAGFPGAAWRRGAPQDTLTREGPGYPASHEPPGPGSRGPSFLVDFDEPAVAPVIAAVRDELGPAPSARALANFVGAYITRKDLARRFDVLSTVARRREGDCTEHAVLLTGLARAFGIPARLVIGIVVVEVEGKATAAGHVWVEVEEGGGWQPVDAALLDVPTRVYLPLEVLADEGPGFQKGFIDAAAAMLTIREVAIEDGPRG